jgi:hypothetical protein
MYDEFLDIMKSFKAKEIDTSEVGTRMLLLFIDTGLHVHIEEELILGFNRFMPSEYSLDYDTRSLNTPHGIFRPFDEQEEGSCFRSQILRKLGQDRSAHNDLDQLLGIGVESWTYIGDG